jgi:chemotaxis protein CheZ
MAQTNKNKLRDKGKQAPELLTSSRRNRTKEVMSGLEDNDLASASDLTGQTSLARNQSLDPEVGRLSRDLHNAPRDLNLQRGTHVTAKVEREPSEMLAARSRLNDVFTITENAANKTLGRVDLAALIRRSIVDSSIALQNDWQVLLVDPTVKSQDHSALFEQVEHPLSVLAKQGERIHTWLTDILFEQGYQDLSGQVIKRVIELISKVKKSLVRLVKIASNSGVVVAIQPQ